MLVKQDKLEIANQRWLGLGNLFDHDWYKQLLIGKNNPLLGRNQEDIENPGKFELRLLRKTDYLSHAAKVLCNIENPPFQSVILEELWNRPFPLFVASRGGSKTFTLGLYSLLKCALVPRTKIVVAGAAFRQSKMVLENMEAIWNQAPILRSIFNSNQDGCRKDIDRWTFRLGESTAIAIPIGTGATIRGLRANIIIADEFASHDPNIFEEVISGFAAVSQNPVQNVKEAARREALKEFGLWSEASEEKYLSKTGNQAIISGTADFGFGHFAEYWKKYYVSIRSKGDPYKKIRIPGYPEELCLNDVFHGDIPSEFNHRDYSIIRIPYELLPKGFMDDKNVARAKSTVSHQGIYWKEYGAVFVSDTNGFFKRSLIEGCVGRDNKPINLPSGAVFFDALVKGSYDKDYVIGIDCASEKDNFAIVVLELHVDHTRVVYCWTTNRKDFKKRAEKGVTDVGDFYGFCVRKIRDLMRAFPCVRIGCDSQSGGVAIEEGLQDPLRIMPGELPIYRILDEKESKDKNMQAWDARPGKHMLEMVNFANAEWTSKANHGMRKDMEDKVLLFPRFDPITLQMALEEDKKVAKEGGSDRIYDTLEDCSLEIEELKNELSTIVLTRTGTGVQSRERWDTPETKTETGKKGYLRKDRYSALVIANALARGIHRKVQMPEYNNIGASLKEGIGKANGPLYSGPDWYMEGIKNIFG